MGNTLKELRQKENEKKLRLAQTELSDLVKGFNEDNIVLDARLVALPNGLMAEPVLRIVEEEVKKEVEEVEEATVIKKEVEVKGGIKNDK